MSDNYVKISDEQFRFLMVLYALNFEVSIEILDILAPLTPGKLFELMRISEKEDLICQMPGNRFCLGKNLPDHVSKKLESMCNKTFLVNLINRIYSSNLASEIDQTVLAGLLARSGRSLESASMENDLAEKELANRNYEAALDHLRLAIGRLRQLDDHQSQSLFLSLALKLSNLCFLLGKYLLELHDILIKAQEISIKLGDRRSKALINLQLGGMYWLAGENDASIKALSVGLEGVMELGDNDILNQSAELIGAYYFFKGQHREAMTYLERVENFPEVNTEIGMPMTQLIFIYCAIYLGQFHRVIGLLDAHLRQAEARGNDNLCSILGSMLGHALTLIKRYKEAEIVLNKARERSISTNNAIAQLFSGAGLALLAFSKGDYKKSYDFFDDALTISSKCGLTIEYATPIVLEVNYGLLRLGFKPRSKAYVYPAALESLLNGTNIHLKGVAFRINAQIKEDQGNADIQSIMSDLQESKKCLEASGDRMQLAKTLLYMAHLELIGGNKKKAGEHANTAWRLYSGYATDLFPDQFKPLLNKRVTEVWPNEELVKSYLAMTNSIKAAMEQEEILERTIISTNEFFGAERGGLFWFDEGKQKGNPTLRASINLWKDEVESEAFKPYLDLVWKAYHSNKAIVFKNTDSVKSFPDGKIRSILCIPIEVRGITRCVLYHDNSYLSDAFDYLDPLIMKLLGRLTSDLIDFIMNHLRIKQEIERLSGEKESLVANRSAMNGIIARSPAATKQLALAHQAALTDTTVLIMGETGTGKGLLAGWIHEQSRRAGNPFIVVDCTTIPENLFESELFGYEKGAFTGAEKQKLGRFELANKGTLFLDEIGELPPQVQIKLLKTLEEKTFVRIGGGKIIRSDFRLIVATNRNLKDEVAAGRFREDLFYRLSVFPITMPPLRERGEDIIELARHFIKQYAKHYGRQSMILSPGDTTKLLKYAWPGNVRELQNVIERAVIVSGSGELQLGLSLAEPQKESADLFADKPTLDEMQRRYIKHILKVTNDRISGPGGAAEILGMKRTSLYSRMRTLGISK